MNEINLLTWPNIENYLAEHPNDATIIIPIGPIEEHGSHLPIGTDIISAIKIAQLVAEKHHCLVFPAIPLMVCGISRETTGTYSISSKTLRLITKDLVLQFVKKGFRQILFFTGHGGYSLKIIREVIDEITSTIHVNFKADIINFEEACPDQNEIVGTTDILDTHAGGIETSRAMFLTPENIKYPLPSANFHNKRELSPSGICGDPQRAEKEKGQIIVEKTISIILNWLNN